MRQQRFSKYFAMGVLALSAFSLSIFTKQEKPIQETLAWNINQTPNVDADYYSACDGKTGSALKSALKNFNKPDNPSYDWSRYEAADEAQDDSSSVLCLYTRHNIKKTAHVGSYSWDTWNREHVYPQGNFPNSDKDNHNIFACEGQINNTRANKSFADIDHSKYNPVSEFGHVTECYSTGSYFEPCDEAKGEVARACLYCTIYYGYDLSQIFDSEQTALKWHAQFPVTPREIYRNNVIYDLQGNRNPFIDHPSYANLIYGANYSEPDPLGDDGTPYVTSVSISKTSLTLDLNGKTSETLTATVAVKNDAPQTVTWSSSNTNVATVNNGVVSAVGKGTTTIRATSTFNIAKYGECTVTVIDSNNPDPEVVSVTISPSSLNLDLNGIKTSTLTASVYSLNGAPESVTWSTSNPAIASVNNGVVTALAKGNVTIKATSTFDTTKYDSCSVVVNDSTPVASVLESIEVTPPNKLTYFIGEQLDTTGMKVTAKYSNGTSKDVTSQAKVDPLDSSSKGTRYIFVSYTENGVTKMASFSVTIDKKPSDSQSENQGCSGSVIASSILISTTSLLGAGLIFIKKRRKFEE